MSTWIALQADVFENRKVVAAANQLTHGDREKLVGHLGRLWTWCADHAEGGDLSHLSARDIAQVAGWRGHAERFVTALTTVGLLDPGPRVHDWDEYAGKLIDRRRRDRQRKAQERAASRMPSASASNGQSFGQTRDGPQDSPRTVRTHRTEPDRTEQDQGYAAFYGRRAAKLHEEHAKGAAVPQSARTGSPRYDPPTRRDDGTLADSTGRVWPDMDAWSASVRERKSETAAQ